MDFVEKLNYLMKVNKLNKSTLSKASGIPYTTIDGIYKRGYDRLYISTVRALASFFNVTIDYLVYDSIEDPSYGKLPGSTGARADADLLIAYHRADDKSKAIVDLTLEEYKPIQTEEEAM